MSTAKFVEAIKSPLMNQTISGTSPVNSSMLTMTSIGSVSFVIIYGSGLNASFQVLASLDGINFVSMNQSIQSATGSSGSSGVSCDMGAFKYALVQVSPSSGSSNVLIQGRAVTNP